MKWLEAELSGLPAAKGSVLFQFEPGLNAWKQKGPVPLQAVRETILATLYPGSRQDLPLGPAKCRLASLTFEASQNVYKIVRDFERRKIKLLQQDPTVAQGFKEISGDSRFILEFLSRSVKLPNRKTYAKFLMCADDPEVPEAAETSHPQFGDGAERLKELRAEAAQLSLVTELEFKVDGLQSQLFQIEDKLKRIEGPREHLLKLKTQYEPYAIFDQPGVLSQATLEKVKNHPKQAERKVEDLKALEDRAQELLSEIELIPKRPVWQEPILFGGVAQFLVGFILASFHRAWLGVWLTVAIAGLFVSLFGWFRGLRRLQSIEEKKKALKALDTEKAGIEKRFEIESATVRKFFETVHESDVETLFEKLKDREDLKRQIAEAQSAFDEASRGLNDGDLKREREVKEREIASLQAKLSEMPPVSMDPTSIEREIKELEARSHGFEGQMPSFSEDTRDEVNDLLHMAAEILQEPSAQILARSLSALTPNLVTITQKRFLRPVIQNGSIAGFETAEGAKEKFLACDRATQLRLKFAVQFTLWQLLTASRPMPLLVDLSKGPPDSQMDRMFLAAAKHLSGKTQVLYLSA